MKHQEPTFRKLLLSLMTLKLKFQDYIPHNSNEYKSHVLHRRIIVCGNCNKNREDFLACIHIKLIKDSQWLSSYKVNSGTKLFRYFTNAHVIVLNPDIWVIHTGSQADFSSLWMLPAITVSSAYHWILTQAASCVKRKWISILVPITVSIISYCHCVQRRSRTVFLLYCAFLYFTAKECIFQTFV